MAINGKTKALRTPPLRWVSTQLVYVWVSAWWRSRWCSQNLRRPFLRAVRFDYLINYLITLRGTIFPYQECNVGYKSVIHVCDVCICWALWVQCGALWQSLVHQSDTSMLSSVREVWCMFVGFVLPLRHQLDTYALKLCESCLFCVFWVLWPSPVTSCFHCITHHEIRRLHTHWFCKK